MRVGLLGMQPGRLDKVLLRLGQEPSSRQPDSQVAGGQARVRIEFEGGPQLFGPLFFPAAL